MFGRNLTVEMAVVNDAARHDSFRAFGGRPAMTSNTLEVINGASALYAGTQGFHQGLSLVVLSQETFEKDPWPVEKFGEDGRAEAHVLFRNFTAWSKRQIGTPRDNHVLLTGLDLLRGVAGVGHFKGMCTSDYSHNMNRCPQRIPSGTCSFILSHELGHNLGMNHDGHDNNCAAKGNIMGAHANAAAGKAGFSDCSVEDFNE